MTNLKKKREQMIISKRNQEKEMLRFNSLASAQRLATADSEGRERKREKREKKKKRQTFL